MKEEVERYLEGGEGISRNQSCGGPGGNVGKQRFGGSKSGL